MRLGEAGQRLELQQAVAQGRVRGHGRGEAPQSAARRPGYHSQDARLLRREPDVGRAPADEQAAERAAGYRQRLSQPVSPGRRRARPRRTLRRSSCRTRCGPAPVRPAAAASPDVLRPPGRSCAPRCAPAAAARRRSRPDPRRAGRRSRRPRPGSPASGPAAAARTSAASCAATSSVPSSDRRWYWSSRSRSRSCMRAFSIPSDVCASSSRMRRRSQSDPSSAREDREGAVLRRRERHHERRAHAAGHDLWLAPAQARSNTGASSRTSRSPRVLVQPHAGGSRRGRPCAALSIAASQPKTAHARAGRFGSSDLHLGLGRDRDPQPAECLFLTQPLSVFATRALIPARKPTPGTRTRRAPAARGP